MFFIIVTQEDGNKEGSGAKPISTVNWKDYLVFFLLALPVIAIIAVPQPRSIGQAIVTFISYGGLPAVYLTTRIFGWSRVRAIGSAVGFFFLAILVGFYIVEGRPFLGPMSGAILIGFSVAILWYSLKQKR